MLGDSHLWCTGCLVPSPLNCSLGNWGYGQRGMYLGNVVHCVRVPSIGTTTVVFATYVSMVGIASCILYLLCVQYCGLLGAPLPLFVMSPHPSNAARLICVILCVYM